MGWSEDFTALYRRWWPRVREEARKLLGSEGEAGDAAQQVFARLWESGDWLGIEDPELVLHTGGPERGSYETSPPPKATDDGVDGCHGGCSSPPGGLAREGAHPIRASRCVSSGHRNASAPVSLGLRPRLSRGHDAPGRRGRVGYLAWSGGKAGGEGTPTHPRDGAGWRVRTVHFWGRGG